MSLGYDSVDANALPPGGTFYFGYVNGRWANFHDVKARFPGKPVLGIAVSSTADADCLDIETGDATPATAPLWVSRQLARGLARPIVYASQWVMPAVLAALQAVGIDRAQVRVWTAHYGVRHMCSPQACGADGFTADATQWAGYPGGGSPGHYDITFAVDSFLAAEPPPPPPPPVPIVLEDELRLISNAKDAPVAQREWSLLVVTDPAHAKVGRRHIGPGEMSALVAAGVPQKDLTRAQYNSITQVTA